jgi:Ca2+-binding EF-hand superfamily protein
MEKIGHPISQEDLDEIMKEHDKAHDGKLSYLEFKAIFLDVADSK